MSELLSEEAARHAGAKPDQPAPIASPDELDELEQARFQGRHVAEITKKLHG